MVVWAEETHRWWDSEHRLKMKRISLKTCPCTVSFHAEEELVLLRWHWMHISSCSTFPISSTFCSKAELMNLFGKQHTKIHPLRTCGQRSQLQQAEECHLTCCRRELQSFLIKLQIWRHRMWTCEAGALLLISAGATLCAGWSLPYLTVCVYRIKKRRDLHVTLKVLVLHIESCWN